MNHLQELLESIGLSPMAYSGRGMYGKECLAVVLTRGTYGQVLQDLADALPDLGDLVKILRDMRMEALGHDTIAHWPEIPFNAPQAPHD